MANNRYAINGTELQLQPSSGKWLQRRVLGVNGNNQAIYAPVYSFEMTWEIMSVAQFKQLYDFWNAVSSAGVVSAFIPTKSTSDYDTFTTYSDVVIDEPEVGEFFSGNVKNVRVQLRNIVL